MRLAFGLALLTLSLSCQVTTPEDPVTDPAVDPVADALAASPGAPGAPRAPQKPKHRVEITRAAWPQGEPDHALASEMTSEARAALAAAVVPVMMPTSPAGALGPALPLELTRRATLMTKPTFVAWSSQTDDRSVTVSLSSSVVVHQHAEVRSAEPTSSVRGGRPAWVLQNEGIWSVAWEEFNVWYVVELECSRPGEDARCKDDAAVRDLVESLRFVGPEASR